MTQMVGSYAPKLELQSFITPVEDAPSGMLYRGQYTVHSLFTDDDGHEHLKWEWSFEIKKDWKWREQTVFSPTEQNHKNGEFVTNYVMALPYPSVKYPCPYTVLLSIILSFLLSCLVSHNFFSSFS